MEAFFTFLTAVASATAAVFAAKYAKDAVRATRASLFGQFLQEYSTDSMGHDMECLRRWQSKHGATFADVYLAGLTTEPPPHGFAEVKDARRRISQYFKKLARLTDADLVQVDTLAKLYGWRPFAFCLEVLVPFDDAHHRHVTGKPDHSRWRDFYQRVHDEAQRTGRE